MTLRLPSPQLTDRLLETVYEFLYLQLLQSYVCHTLSFHVCCITGCVYIPRKSRVLNISDIHHIDLHLQLASVLWKANLRSSAELVRDLVVISVLLACCG